MIQARPVMQQSHGTILKLYPLGEQGLIVVWLSPDYGIIRTAARSARKAGSDFFGQLDLFYESEFLCTAAKKGDLYGLKSVQLIRPRLQLRGDLTKLRLASYMARLILATVEAGHAEACWHELLAGGLDYLNDTPASLAIMRHFEKRLAQLHGVYSPEQEPHRSLLTHFHSLPAGRQELIEAFC
ncbi:MAG: DNA repair protein RecO [Akkermansia sp.]